jgi:hypothetical protein
MTIETLTFDAFAARYCERQMQTPEGLRTVLQAQRARYRPKGWCLLECHQLDSSRCGELTIIPFGPENTFKEPPTHPVSPRGLASDMAIVVALLPASAL